jgi:sulfate permease, SulP family
MEDVQTNSGGIYCMIYKLMPGLKQLLHYKPSFLLTDAVAGLTVAILFIPQCIAYSLIAGVPPNFGLYSATLPLLVYVLFGTSKYLSVGPVSVVSLLAFSGISSISDPGSIQYLHFMVILGLIVGGIQLLLGCINIGKVFDYIPSTLISAFISAVAIVIAFNQIEHIIGVPLQSYKELFAFFNELVVKIQHVNYYTLSIGFGCIVFLLYIKRYCPILPGSFIVVILSTLIVDNFNITNNGVAIVGSIPQGFPEITFPSVEFYMIKLIFPIALGIAIISFLESYAVAKSLAEKEGDSINANEELRGLGFANISSSFVSAIPVAGAISRTAVNYQTGAKTNFSLIVTLLSILVTLLFFTPLFYSLPKASLASIIIVSVIGLVDVKKFKRLINNPQLDTITFMVTFFTTLSVGVFNGLLCGILISVVLSFFKRIISNNVSSFFN